MLRRDCFTAAAASTNTPSVAMSKSQLSELVEKDMCLSAEEKVACVQKWKAAMAVPVCSCASCGIRTAPELPGAALEERGLDPGVGHDVCVGCSPCEGERRAAAPAEAGRAAGVATAEPGEPSGMDSGSDGGSTTGDDDDPGDAAVCWDHLEVKPAFLREVHPVDPLVASMKGYDVCLAASGFPDHPIGEGAVGWRAEVLGQRKAGSKRQPRVQVNLFGVWFDLAGEHVLPLCQLRTAAPRAAAPRARERHAAYTWHRLQDLLALQMTPEEHSTWQAARERLQGFPLLGPSGVVEQHVDLARMCSVYESSDGGAAFWLHPELVDGRGSEPACILCHTCSAAVQQGVRPSMNVANVDYGWQARVPEVGQLSVLEELLLSPTRLYHVVVKVCRSHLALARPAVV